MHDSQQSDVELSRVIEMVTKDNESLRKEIQYLYEEINLLKMRIPTCPCGNTMVSVEEVGYYK
jgi:hypothetical protein